MRDLEGLPGQDLIEKGLHDLAHGEVGTQEALLLAMARTKLQRLGLPIPPVTFEVEEAELKFYALLCLTEPDPYHQYNALRRRLGRFERALEARVHRMAHTHREGRPWS